MRNRLMIGASALLLASTTLAVAQDQPQPGTAAPQPQAVESQPRPVRVLRDIAGCPSAAAESARAAGSPAPGFGSSARVARRG